MVVLTNLMKEERNKGIKTKCVSWPGVGADGACLVGLAAVNNWGLALFLLNFGSAMGAVGMSGESYVHFTSSKNNSLNHANRGVYL